MNFYSPGSISQLPRHKTPIKFGDARFERMVRVAKSNRSETPALKEQATKKGSSANRKECYENQGSALRHAKELERVIEGLYEPTAMLPQNESVLPELIRQTKRLSRLAENHFRNLKFNRTLRVKALDSTTDNPSNAFILTKTTLRRPLKNGKLADSVLKAEMAAIKKAELYWLEQRKKMACALIAFGNSNWNNKGIKRAFGLIDQSLKRYMELRGNKLSPVPPILIQALSLRGTKALDHEVHSQAVKELGAEELARRNDVFEGLETRFPEDLEQANRFEHRMLSDQEFLTQAVQLVPQMKGTQAVKNFVMAALLHRKAELEHALEHYDSTSPGNGRHILKARHIVDLATDYLSRIPKSQHSLEHSRLAYNLKAQAKHFCQHKPHSFAHTSVDRNVCQTLLEDAAPMQEFIIETFPNVNRQI